MAGIIKVDRVQSDSNLAFNIAGANVAFMDTTSLRMVSSNLSLAGTNVISNGKLITSAQPTGAVLQVAQARKTDTSWSTSTTSFTAVTGLSVTLTPTSTTSKFLISSSVSVGSNWWAIAGGYFGVTASTGATPDFGDGTNQWVFQYGADSTNSPYETMQWIEETLYTPGTTSPVTINVVLASGGSGSALYLNRAFSSATRRGSSWLTVWEIAG